MRAKAAFDLLFIACFLLCSQCAKGPDIDIWYGHQQHFGKNGYPQRWVNILGRVSSPHGVASLHYSLNNAAPQPLTIGPDRRRLANQGDFNVEIAYAMLKQGINKVTVTALDSSSGTAVTHVDVYYDGSQGCPLPYRIDWSEVKRIEETAQVVDGRWQLTNDGVRILEPYYDRVIAFGDSSWTDYEVTVPVTFHGMRVPVKGRDGGAGVIHAAVAVRWPGHDPDDRQPRVKWYPLGATAEFRVNPDLKNCSWRILGGGRKVVEESKTRDLELDVHYIMKHRVETLADSSSQYSVKLWPAGQSEPSAWDLQGREGLEDVQSGAALLLAHYTDVTFGDVQVEPVH